MSSQSVSPNEITKSVNQYQALSSDLLIGSIAAMSPGPDSYPPDLSADYLEMDGISENEDLLAGRIGYGEIVENDNIVHRLNGADGYWSQDSCEIQESIDVVRSDMAYLTELQPMAYTNDIWENSYTREEHSDEEIEDFNEQSRDVTIENYYYSK